MRVVEIPDDGVGSPADGNEVQETGDGKKNTRDACDSGFEAVYTYAFSALDSEDRQSQSQTTEQDREHSEATGCLHVTGQSQQAVVHLTLDLTRALHYAIHPKTFPDNLSRHDVVADEGRDAPQRDGTDYCPAHPAHNGHDEAQQLHASGCHDEKITFVSNSISDRLFVPQKQVGVHFCFHFWGDDQISSVQTRTLKQNKMKCLEDGSRFHSCEVGHAFASLIEHIFIINIWKWAESHVKQIPAKRIASFHTDVGVKLRLARQVDCLRKTREDSEHKQLL